MSDHGRAHAVLSPSSAERWIACPASVRMTESVGRPDEGSTFAEEGTRAHNLGEIKAAHVFGLITSDEYETRLLAWLETADAFGDDVDDMERHVAVYVSLLEDIVASRPGTPRVYLEQRVQTGIPGAWGTGDAIIVTPTTIDVVDYKHGQGVRVNAAGNPQARMYGLGGLKMFDGVLGNVETVTNWICQPRAGGVTSEALSAADLRAWRDQVALPAAIETQNPAARFGPSDEACRWCPAAGACKVRAASVLQRDFGNPDLLDEAGLAEAWQALPSIKSWAKAVEAEALQRVYGEDKPLPGLKVVLSGGKRSIADAKAAIERLVEAGYDLEKVSRPSVQTLGVLDRLVGGKDKLPEILGDALNKGEGRPSLVFEDDPREPYSRAIAARNDFQAAAEGDPDGSA